MNDVKLKGLSKFLFESIMGKKTLVFSFGRLNPPTNGHELLVNKLKQVSEENDADAKLFLSKSHDLKTKRKQLNNIKNPLPPEKKLFYVKKSFGHLIDIELQSSVFDILEKYNGIYTDIIMLVGSDRVEEFENLLKKYQGDKYNFDSIKVLSVGERDADSDDVSGMSASKMRSFAVNDDFKSFLSGIPSTLNKVDAKQMFNDIKTNMIDIKEFLNKNPMLKEIFNSSTSSTGSTTLNRSFCNYADYVSLSPNRSNNHGFKILNYMIKESDVQINEPTSEPPNKNFRTTFLKNNKTNSYTSNYTPSTVKSNILNLKENKVLDGFSKFLEDYFYDKQFALMMLKEVNKPIDKQLLNEITSTFTAGANLSADDGPIFSTDRIKKRSEVLGYKILNHMVKEDLLDTEKYPIYPNGPVSSVSFGPAGLAGTKTPHNQTSHLGQQAYNKWNIHVSNIVDKIGMKIVNYLGAKGLETEVPDNSSNMSTYLTEGILNEGGAAGHMKHPYEDNNLSFKDLKNMIDRSLSGQLHVEKKVTEKCLDGESVLNLEKNGFMKIKDIVDNKIQDKVLSYNDGVCEYKNIDGYSNNGETEDWLLLETEDGRSITVTPNHRIFTKTRGYVKASELNKDDELVVE